MDTSEAGWTLSQSRARVNAICQRCNVPFTTYADKPGRFCSHRCRQSDWAERHREEERARLRAYRQRRAAQRGGE